MITSSAPDAVPLSPLNRRREGADKFEMNRIQEADMARTAIVTGGARGIGAAVAKKLAADGMSVAVLDLDAAACEPVVDEIRAAGGTAIAVGANVADEAEVGAAVDRIASELGAPTVLVNNAGIIRDNMLHKMSVDDWDAVMGVHLRGAF